MPREGPTHPAERKTLFIAAHYNGIPALVVRLKAGSVATIVLGPPIIHMTSSKIFATVATPVIVASLVVLPFVILEAINRRGFGEGFPLPLFVAMWLLPATFMVVLTSLLRRLRAGDRVSAHLGALVPPILLLIVIVWFWLSLVVDQLPCFLGVPNCD